MKNWVDAMPPHPPSSFEAPPSAALRMRADLFPKQFQEKCAAVFRPELLDNKEIERFRVSVKS
ncbi:hypothetical protein CCGE531_00295 [Rhizobium sp. CCGE531]|nr:hypothetical protein CCGE531_00295 [Rhizobium sp. CCGE531]AYG71094.1 hypothetical protein CCGE532_00295 [Rhizobium sp. CCGE532]